MNIVLVLKIFHARNLLLVLVKTYSTVAKSVPGLTFQLFRYQYVTLNVPPKLSVLSFFTSKVGILVASVSQSCWRSKRVKEVNQVLKTVPDIHLMMCKC